MAAPQILKFPADMTTDPAKRNFLKMRFYTRTKGVTSPTNPTYKLIKRERVPPDIFLPLTSDAFREMIAMSYSPKELGILGNIIYNEAKKVNDLSSESIQQVLKNAMSIGAISNSLPLWAATQILTSEQDAVKSAAYTAGFAYNPNLTLFYDGKQQNYRVFRFNWTLYPKSELEAEQLLQIEKRLLQNALPRTVNEFSNQQINYNNHYQYPYEVELTCYVDNIEFTKFQFLPGVIQYVEISHHDGQDQNETTFVRSDQKTDKLYYSSTTINMGFQEKEVFTRNYVDELKTAFNPNVFVP